MSPPLHLAFTTDKKVTNVRRPWKRRDFRRWGFKGHSNVKTKGTSETQKLAAVKQCLLLVLHYPVLFFREKHVRIIHVNITLLFALFVVHDLCSCLLSLWVLSDIIACSASLTLNSCWNKHEDTVEVVRTEGNESPKIRKNTETWCKIPHNCMVANSPLVPEHVPCDLSRCENNDKGERMWKQVNGGYEWMQITRNNESELAVIGEYGTWRCRNQGCIDCLQTTSLLRVSSQEINRTDTGEGSERHIIMQRTKETDEEETRCKRKLATTNTNNSDNSNRNSDSQQPKQQNGT